MPRATNRTCARSSATPSQPENPSIAKEHHDYIQSTEPRHRSPRGHPRRQPNSVCPLQHRVCHRLQPGDADGHDPGACGPFQSARRTPGRRGGRRRDEARPRLQPGARIGPLDHAVARHAGVRHSAGLRHRPGSRHAGGQQDRAGPHRVWHCRRRGHHVGCAGRAEREAAQDPAGGQPCQDHRPAPERTGQGAPRHAGPAGPATKRRATHRPVNGRACRTDGRRMGHQPRGPGRTGAQEPPEPGARL
ncbi:MAG: hypothetical protein BWX79_02058 [Alphaproteobacteria bacterium ADurb.Bin100]|nr:MAG: hypothetical protein BWX79_02058 [Alphaproteobacteria bacterium ADurb.Bin100]